MYSPHAHACAHAFGQAGLTRSWQSCWPSEFRGGLSRIWRAAAGATAQSPRTAGNPVSNTAPTSPFQCGAGDDVSNSCISSELQNIDYARSLEGVAAMTLPPNYANLTLPEQYLAVFNLERTARGLQAEYGLASEMDGQAQQAADTGQEPSSVPNRHLPRAGGLFITYTNPLEADYYFMYYDGWGGSATTTVNSACTSSSASDCWTHRDIILNTMCTSGACMPVMGAAASSDYSAAVFGDYAGGIPPASGIDALRVLRSTCAPGGPPELLDVESDQLARAATIVTIRGVYLTGATSRSRSGRTAR